MIGALGCAGDPPASDPQEPEVPGFRAIHDTILVPGCGASACHGGEQGVAGFRVGDAESALADLIGVAPVNAKAADEGLVRVAPGDPENSFLWRKLNDSPEELFASSWGAPMPLAATEVPGPDALAAIQAWIQGGAPLEGAEVTPDWVVPDIGAYVSCDATDEEGMQACFAPGPEGSKRVYTKPMIIPGASEELICAPVPAALAEELLVTAASGQQMVGGHHAAVYVRDVVKDEEPHPCTSQDMLELRFVVGAGGAGGVSLALPEGMALRVAPGQQLVIQSHYINTSPEPRTVMDAVDLHLVDPAESPEIADAFAVLADDIDIPPFAVAHEAVKECVIDREMDIHLLLGHTHDFGVLFQMEHVPAEGPAEVLYWATDGALLRDDPEVTIYEEPLQLVPGDKLRVTCQWTNTTAEPLGWPAEMCVGFMYYTPAEGFLICDDSGPSPEILGGGGDALGCVPEDQAGNELGVGKHCTASGTECQGNGAAGFCLAAFDAASNFCSLIGCSTDDECGEGATCVIESLGSACVPDFCL